MTKLHHYLLVLTTFAAVSFSGLGCNVPAGGTPASSPMPEEAEEHQAVDAGDTEEPAAAPGGEAAMHEREAWKAVDGLIRDQKMAEALDRLSPLLDAARTEQDTAGWTRALITGTQLRTALSGFETAVRFLRSEPWPDDPKAHLVLELFYAHALVRYRGAYAYNMAQRERVVSTDRVDLAAWTGEQIAEETHAAFARTWQLRRGWGEASLGGLAEYVEQNSYPARIRGTLRDSVSYLWAEALADQGAWTPAESNGVHRLDLEALIAGRPELDGDLDRALTDPSVHPLAKLAAVLGDLERWHAAGERPEAAFEAYRQRLEHLRTLATGKRDRAWLVQALEKRLEDLGRRLPWWSVGQATRAALLETGDSATRLIDAHRAATDGAEAFPGSVGGQRCRAIADRIEAPSFQLAGMAVDGPGKRSLGVSHKNIERLHFRAYRLSLETILGSRSGPWRPVDPRAAAALIANRKPDAAWTIDLPATTDYGSHRTDIIPPFEEAGFVLVMASERGDFRAQNNLIQGVILQLTELVLLSRLAGDGRVVVSVRRGESGSAVADARVSVLRWQRDRRTQTVTEAMTDGQGRVELAVPERQTWALLARHGDAFVLDTQAQRVGRPSRPSRREPHTLVYTDRAIYRPGQDLLWKTVTYAPAPDGETERAAPRRFLTRAGEAITVVLRDANNEVVAEQAVTTNEFGSASGRFALPAGRLLGGWHLQATWNGHASIRVEAYKRPTFEVVIDDPPRALRLSRSASVTGTATFHFGLPVTEGRVFWRVVRAPDIRPYWGRMHGWPQPGPPEVIAAGRSSLDADGRFTLAFVPDGDERLGNADPAAVRYRFRVEADVSAAGGETRSAKRSFTVGAVAVEAQIEPEGGFFAAGANASLRIKRSDLDGTPRQGAGRWRLVRLAQPSESLLPADQPLPPAPADREPFLTAGDRRRPRWQPGYDPAQLLRGWADGDEIARGTLAHDSAGEATLTLEDLPAGPLRLVYQTDDPFGATFEARQELIVHGAGGQIALPAVLVVERTLYEPGERAQILVASGRAGLPLVLEAWRGATPVLRREMAGGGAPVIVELPIGQEDRGGITLRLSAIGDYQLMTLEERLEVPFTDRALDISFATFRDRLRPGDEETWRIEVRGEEGALAAGSAELLASMYDQSLNLFAEHHPPRLTSVYPRWPAPPRPVSVLGSAMLVHAGARGFDRSLPPAPPTSDRLRFLDDYPIGGPGRLGAPGGPMVRTMMTERLKTAVADDAPGLVATAQSFDLEAVASDAVAPPGEAAGGHPAGGDPVRENFAETAFWHPHLLLDEDGGVTFSFTVPDAVTSWTVWVEALTRGLRGGASRTTVRTARELLVRPQIPRFLRQGDRAQMVVSIDNTGDVALDGTLDVDVIDPSTGTSRAAAFGLAAGGLKDVAFHVEPGRTISLDVLLVAPSDLGAAALRVVGRAGDVADGELRPLPVLPGRMHLVTSRFAAVEPGKRRRLAFGDLADDDPERTDELLVVQVDGQLLMSVLEAVPYLIDYPYPSVEASTERFVAAGTLVSLFDRVPALGEVAQQMAKERDHRLEAFDQDDPNRRTLLIETPWLQASAGGGDSPWGLLRILDPDISARTRDQALDELVRAQRSDGAFPWFPGGPASPTITLQVLSGLSRALEMEVASVPEDVVRRAWGYLARHFRDDLEPRMKKADCCGETATFLAYVLSSYRDAERWTGGVLTEDDRSRLLDLGFRQWRKSAPLTKVYLSLALARAGREDEATAVLDSVLDSARSDPDLGTFWQPEERAWLFYRDTIVTHATVLRAIDELRPSDPRRGGLIQWLLLNKQLNHWRSTRATAEVLFTVAASLERDAPLAAADTATVQVGDRQARFTFTPRSYLERKNRLVIAGPAIDPTAMREIAVANQGARTVFARATWHYATDRPPERGDGDLFHIERTYFRRIVDANGPRLEPIGPNDRITVGDQLEIQLELHSRAAAEYVHVRDPRPAGLEPESQRSGYRWGRGVGWYQQVGDSGADLFFERLPAGTATVRYRLRANVAGRFKAAPAVIQSVYAPAFAGHSAGGVLEILPPTE